MPHSQGYSILTLFMLSSPPQPHPPFIKGKKNIQLAENVSENTYFFYLCLSVSVVFVISLHLCCPVFIHHSV